MIHLQPRRSSTLQAMLLLEVVVAMTIMVAALGALGAQLCSGLRMTAEVEELTRAAQLADRMLALLELDPNTVTQFVAEQQADGDFGEQHPEWFWRAYAEELEETENLEEERRISRITIEILHQPGVGDDGDIEQARVVRSLHLLKAAPGTLDLEDDFGVPAEQVETIKELIANIAPDAITEDGEINLQVLMQYTGLEDLFTLMPMLAGLADGGFGGGDIGGMLGGGTFSMDGVQELLQAGGFGDISPDMIQQLIGGMGGAGALGNLGDLGNLADLAGGFGGDAGTNAIIQMIQAQLGDQLSPEDINMLLGTLGQSGLGGGGGGGRGRGGGGGDGGGRGPGGDGGGGGRGPGGDGGGGSGGGRGGPGGRTGGRDISDLNNEREARNKDWRDR